MALPRSVLPAALVYPFPRGATGLGNGRNLPHRQSAPEKKYVLVLRDRKGFVRFLRWDSTPRFVQLPIQGPIVLGDEQPPWPKIRELYT